MATAFKLGHYGDPNSNESFGSGQYGDLGALVAALLLDREARSVVLDADPAHGSLLEPFLKVVRIFKSLSFTADDDWPFVEFDLDLKDVIGEEPHKIPSVFSFFLPEFQDSGKFRSCVPGSGSFAIFSDK